MFKEVSELCLAQTDGGLPTPVAAGSAPGESGVFVFNARFHGGLHLSARPRRHHICFQLTSHARFDCRIAGQAMSHRLWSHPCHRHSLTEGIHAFSSVWLSARIVDKFCRVHVPSLVSRHGPLLATPAHVVFLSFVSASRRLA
jgi:hypothetical protein